MPMRSGDGGDAIMIHAGRGNRVFSRDRRRMGHTRGRTGVLAAGNLSLA